MDNNRAYQASKAQPDPENKQGKSKKPNPAKPKSRKRRLIVYEWCFWLLITLGGILFFVSHVFAIVSIPVLLIGLSFGGLAIRISLINNGATQRVANGWGAAVFTLSLIFCGGLLWYELSCSNKPEQSANNPPDERWISITPGETVNSKRPFDTRFIVQNHGPTTVSNVTCLLFAAPNFENAVVGRFAITNEQDVRGAFEKLKILQSVHPEITNMDWDLYVHKTNNEWRVERIYVWYPETISVPNTIAPEGEYAISLMFNYRGPRVSLDPSGFEKVTQDGVPITPTGIPISTNAILLQIDCRYKPSALPTREQSFQFYAEPDTDSNWRWFPLGSGELWMPTNMPNIAAEPD